MINIGKELQYDKKELRKAYNEALKNNDFKVLCEKLKIDDEILMKYTSFLEESSTEFGNCLNCKGLNECKNSLLSHAYLPRVVNGMLEFNYKKCNYSKSNIYNY